MDIIVILAIITFMVLLFQETGILRNLSEHGILCAGVIKKKGVFRLRSASGIYTVVYMYTFSPLNHKNIEYSRRKQVTQQAYATFSIQNEVELRYLYDNPRIARLWGQNRSPQKLRYYYV